MSPSRPTVAGRPCDSAVVHNNAASQTAEQYFTLLGVRPDGVASVVDLVATEDAVFARGRAEALLREHRSCHLVEVWRGGALVEQLTRQ